MTDALHENQYTFLVISRSVLLMRRVSDQNKLAEEIKIPILCLLFFFKPYRLGDNVEKYCKTGQTADDMHIACWLPMSTNKHSEYITPIAFPLQQWFTNAPQCFVIFVCMLPLC